MQEYRIEKLQSANKSDAESIRHLVTQLDSNFQELTDEDLAALLSSSTTHLYVVRSNSTQEIVGMATLVVYRIPYKMKGWIEDVVVDTKHRGQGIATALLQHIITEAQRLHVKSLNLTSNPKRESARKLYEQLGFEIRETNVFRKNL